ncbi:ER lumen protein-retaining receptor 2 [Durusdinium trenchii]|uniref:ER lumen protein-retaining receptor 2 n=1 Tax=Durusdinium trenchii TaxID=1381693 RepID=A0ABP0IJK3_9DINO
MDSEDKNHGPTFSLEMLKDPEKLKFLAMKYSQTEAFKIWGGFVVIAFVVFMLVSSGDFSFLLTLSSLLSMFSFLMVALKMETNRSCKGVSMKMMECYLVIFFFRLCAIIPFEGYLPFDKSGDWFYQTCEALGFCLAGTPGTSVDDCDITPPVVTSFLQTQT